MSRNDAGSPPIAHFDLTTRLIHLALVAFGVTGLVQAFGLLSFAWMAVTGGVLFYALEPGVRAAGWLRLVKELHEGGQGAVIAYLVLHAGAVVLHAVAGDDLWRRMFFPRARTPNQAASGDRP